MLKHLAFAVALVVGLTTGAQAQRDYPNRLIKLLNGSPPTGNLDVVARILGREIEKSTGQSVVVESTRPGLGGMFSAEAVVRAEPDGYTVVLLSAGYPSYGALSKNVKLKVVDDL